VGGAGAMLASGGGVGTLPVRDMCWENRSARFCASRALESYNCVEFVSILAEAGVKSDGEPHWND
jgi:hypothetical protein